MYRLILVAGTEQHRHNTAEVAVYSLLSYLSEIEVGRRYIMSKVSAIDLLLTESCCVTVPMDVGGLDNGGCLSIN